jgi:hypothetical protein
MFRVRDTVTPQQLLVLVRMLCRVLLSLTCLELAEIIILGGKYKDDGGFTEVNCFNGGIWILPLLLFLQREHSFTHSFKSPQQQQQKT